MYQKAWYDIRETCVKEITKVNKKIVLTALFSVLLLSACSNSEDTHEGHAESNHDAPSEDEVRSLDVELSVPLETVSKGETVELTAHVTSNDENVEDADHVMFEVLSGEDSLDMIEAEHSGDGLYTIEYTFESEGEFRVISHVDAFQLHTMPEENVVVE